MLTNGLTLTNGAFQSQVSLWIHQVAIHLWLEGGSHAPLVLAMLRPTFPRWGMGQDPGTLMKRSCVSKKCKIRLDCFYIQVYHCIPSFIELV